MQLSSTRVSSWACSTRRRCRCRCRYGYRCRCRCRYGYSCRLEQASDASRSRQAYRRLAGVSDELDTRAGDAWTKGSWPKDLSGTVLDKVRQMGFMDEWASLEDLSCVIELDPGDMVFWREDVWHRTQDMNQNRISLIMDILRYPLVGDFELKPGFASTS